MQTIAPNKLKQARDRFHDLLARKTKEAEWQRFFAEHPYVITPSLPLRLEPRDIVPMGRPGKTEPDFIFYPQASSSVNFYGVIELKRPDQKIATVTRENVALLTRTAQSAVLQAEQYCAHAPELIRSELSGHHLFLGNNRYLFVIMGLTNDLIFQPGNELYRDMIQNRLPGNLQILPFDLLLDNFEKRIYREIYILVPTAAGGLVRLRSEPVDDLSHEDARTMLQSKGFCERDWNWVGKGITHQHEPITRRGASVVINHTTGLMWQQGGSEQWMNWDDAQKYLAKLNREKFAGHDDWRLPTLEEAVSLMEPMKKHGNLYIDLLFDGRQ